ncbi:cytochrome P450 [Leifsonia shinshuensis]|uniref:cytochrome P450 n=1 Tax=Leifsonia shinshuensis TaxID=150026 RepID=UPI001F51447D|nr:cytochrome P450 [Leifsonia shinshuensis]MCI0157825.1 cytochrome P450 [Leifsonia shinshuensis]
MDSNSYADDFEPADFSLSNPRIIPDPYPAYEILRQRDPIHNSRMYGGSWVFFAYEDVVTMLTDDRLTNNRSNLPLLALAPEQREEFADLVPVLSNWVAFFDGDAHLLRRQHMNRICNLFSKESLTPIIDRAVDELLSTWGERADLIADFSRPLPAMVITQLLGAPVTDHELLARWSDDIAYLFGASALTVDDLRRGRSAVQQFAGYLGELVSHSVRFGHDTMLAKLAVEESGGFHFDEAAACAQGMLLMFAGLEPTRYLIGNAVWALQHHPRQRQRLQSDPALLSSAVEEFLRYDTPVQFVGRAAARSFTYRGNRIEAGQAVLLHVGSANRDRAVFPDPDELDLARSSNRHVSFGRGPHVCIGALLVRLQAKAALRALLERFPGLRVADDVEPVWNSNLGFHGFTSLTVTTGR